MLHNIVLSLGSNIGDRETYIKYAVILLNDLIGTITALSKFRETEPWGYQSNNKYLNVAIALDTELSPRDCLARIMAIERELGRKRTEGATTYEDRPIDIDILYYDDCVIDEADLIVPHPRISERMFVLEPLCDICPDHTDPLTGLTPQQMMRRLMEKR